MPTTMLYSKTEDEAKVVTFDFGNDAVGSLTGPSVDKSVIVGDDPGATSLNVDNVAIVDLTVTCLLLNGTNDCSYTLTCTATDDDDQIHQAKAALTVTDAAI